VLGELRIGKLLIGNPAEATSDLESAAQAIVRMGDLASHLGQFAESIDLNPLILLGSGCVAVDALVVGRAAVSPAVD
jgi:hypothetical protein